MAAAIAPATPLRLKSSAALRYLSLYNKRNPRPSFLPNSSEITKKPLIFPPFLHRSVPHSDAALPVHLRRCFCSVVSGALQSGDVVETTKQEFADKWRGEAGEKIGEFRKKLRIVDIKDELDEGLGRLGHNLVVRGWVRTLRVQSSVTFIEVTVTVPLYNCY